MSDNTHQIEEYLLHFHAARNLLLSAQRRFDEIAEDLGRDRSERADAVAASLDTTREIALLDAAHATFIATHGPGVAPPSPEAVDRALALANDLAQALAQEQRVQALFDAVTRLATGWRGLTTPAAAPAAVAARAIETSTSEATAEGGRFSESFVVKPEEDGTNQQWLKRQRAAAATMPLPAAGSPAPNKP